MQHHVVTLMLPLTLALQKCFYAIFETYFSYIRDIWIAVTDYYKYIYLIVLSLLTAIFQFINFMAS